MNEVQKIEKEVLNFLQRLEHKLPDALEAVADKALVFTHAAEAVMTGKEVATIEQLVPETEPFATAIVAVLKELEVAFGAVSGAFKKGVLFAAAGQIASIQDGGALPMNRYNLAVQARYSGHPASAA